MPSRKQRTDPLHPSPLLFDMDHAMTIGVASELERYAPPRVGAARVNRALPEGAIEFLNSLDLSRPQLGASVRDELRRRGFHL